MRRSAIALAVLPWSLLLFGCEPPEQPGESVGTFQINGSLDENLCGAAVPALDPIAFGVEIRDQVGRAIWIMDEQPLQEGIRMPDGTFRFRSGTTVPVLAPAPEIGFRGCSLQQVELVEVRVTAAGDEPVPDPDAASDAGTDGGAGVASEPVALQIDGLSEIQFTPTIDSDCSPLPVVNGGPWAALPCTIRYSLFGTGTGPAATDSEP